MNPVNQAMLQLAAILEGKFQANVSLAGFTTARIGGNADGLVIANTVEELAHVVSLCWQHEVPCRVLGKCLECLGQ